MRYSIGAIVLHWLIAALIALNYAAAWVSESLPKDAAAQVMASHKAIGMTVLALTVIRILWRVTHTPPPFPDTLHRWEVLLARAAHGVLYLLMLGVPLAGWVMHSTYMGGQPIPAFGGFAWPGLPLAQDKGAAETFAEVHEVLATAMLALAALHVLGALKHQFVDRNGTLGRMGIGRPMA